jgi:hypothetical protein
MSLIDLIKDLLTHNKLARDNDEHLIVQVWKAKLREFFSEELIETMPLEFFFTIYEKESILPSAESIRRTRQLLQQKDLLLRGNNYQDRQAKAELVRQELGEWS